MHYLNYIGDFGTGFGYGIHTRSFYEALKNVFPLLKHEYGGETSQEYLYEKISKKSTMIPGKAINMHIASPSSYQYMRDHLRGYNIGFTPVDYDYIYPPNRTIYETIDRIWVPTYWGRTVLEQNGLSKLPIDVIPEGFDPNIFYPSEKKNEKELFEFITVGKLEDRKAINVLVKGFEAAFQNEKNVRLHLLIFNGYQPKLDYVEFLKECGVKDLDKYILYERILSLEEIATLYRQCDAAVFTTRSEGWGLPIVDAMACGLPTIVTNYSAQTDYAHKDNAYLLDYKLIQNQSRQYLKFSGLPHELEYFGHWAEPHMDHLIELFRAIYKNQTQAKQIGEFAAKDMLENWTWDHAAEEAAFVLNSISC